MYFYEDLENIPEILIALPNLEKLHPQYVRMVLNRRIICKKN